MIREAVRDFREAVPNAYLKTITKLSLLIYSGDIAETQSDIFLERNKLSEPFDLPDHIGNTREAAITTVAAFGMIAIFKLVEKPREVALRNAKRVAAASFAVSSAVQIGAEHYGISNDLNASNTGDYIDAAYGIGWSGFVAYGAFRLFRGWEQLLHDQAHETQQEQIGFVETTDQH